MKDFSKYTLSGDFVHFVYVYEFSDYKTCYVGRTKELRRRHNSHKSGRKHSDGTLTYDSVYTFAKEHQMPIPEPKVLESNLTAKDSLVLEDFWIGQYLCQGWHILNKAKTGLDCGSLGHISFWTFERCAEAFKKYKTKTALRKNLPGCYDACYRNGWLDILAIEEGKHPNGYWSIKENVINEAKKYDKISDFILKSNGAYVSAKKNGWLNMLGFESSHKDKPELNFDEIYTFYLETKCLSQTMKAFHLSHKQIKKLFADNNVSVWDHGVKNPSPDDIIKIQNDLDCGTSLREIERRYNICRKRIPKIFNMDQYDKRRKKD